MSGTHHCNAGLREYLDVPAYVEHQGWIVDFLQARRVGGIVERDDHDPRCRGLRQFFLRQFERFPRAQRLRGNCEQALRLQFGKRRSENRRDAAKMLHQPAGSTGAEPGGQSQSQPLQCLLARWSIGYRSQCRHGYLYLPVYVG